MWCRIVASWLIALSLSAQATDAGIFDRRKPDPEKYVPELVKTLAESESWRERANAADELGSFDGNQFPMIVPALLRALQSDPDSSVRVQAAQALGNIRPISQQVGYALEQARANDDAMRVRIAARTSLWQYHLVGYRSGRSENAGRSETEEPPLAEPNGAMGRPRNGSSQTMEPPLALPDGEGSSLAPMPIPLPVQPGTDGFEGPRLIPGR